MFFNILILFESFFYIYAQQSGHCRGLGDLNSHMSAGPLVKFTQNLRILSPSPSGRRIIPTLQPMYLMNIL